VKDASGAPVPGAKVVITSIEEGVSRTVITDASGNYRVAELTPGHYRLEFSKDGFRKEIVENLRIAARQELRADSSLQVGSMSQEIVVQDSVAGTINTENASLSATVDANIVTGAATTYRANGDTTPFTLLQILPGVQADTASSSNGTDTRLSIQGGLPSQSEASVDGISTQNVTGNSPLVDMFPSAESIAEVRVEGVGNNAEFGQPGEITTISKSGTNDLHGGVFWYHQNAAFDSTPFGSRRKPKKVANDFGISVGGPVVLPHLYNGHSKSFFFGTYEGLRFPQTQTIQAKVPSVPMRSGDFSRQVAAGYSRPLVNPYTGNPYPNNQLTGISAVAQKFLALIPAPNVGDPNLFNPAGPNFIDNKDSGIRSNQFDLRGDQYISHKALVFSRYTWKNVSQTAPQPILIPASSNTLQDRSLVAAFIYNLRPTLVNEFRFGFSLDTTGQINPYDGPSFAKSLGLAGIGPNFPFNGIADLGFNTISGIGVDRLDSLTKSRTFQFSDNVSWTKGRHVVKYGFDIRHIEAITPLGFFGADNYGSFVFSGNFTRNDVADFLLGVPTATLYDTVSQDNDGKSIHYGVFAQDTWQATPRLTLNYGLRWEFHPAYHDASGNIGNFNPYIPRTGALVYPDGKAALLDPFFLASGNACPAPARNGAACTPVLSNSEAGLPSGLRTAPKTRFMPRLGFAYRPFNDAKTAIRGGFGAFNITTLGSIFYALTGTIQAGTQTFVNAATPSGPAFQWPAINSGGSGYGAPRYGTNYFGTANEIYWKDPYSMQWDLSLDHEFWGGIGASVAYIGMKTNQLVWAPNYNDMSYSTTMAARERPLSDRPFPNWGTLNTRANGSIAFYNALQFEVRRAYRKGLTFDSTYTWAKNLADNQGPTGTTFAGENGGSRATYYYDRHLDYGDVIGSRRHRWVTTFLYDLPVGRGRTVGSSWNRLADSLVGGWQLSSILLIQTGTYLSPNFRNGDPSGTGSGSLFGRRQRPDLVGNPVPANQNASNWINLGAYTCPGIPSWSPGTSCTIGTNSTTLKPIGRFGNAGIGKVVGPGTFNLNLGLSKTFSFTERLRLKAGASFTNVLNHLNLADPELNISSGGFGKITSARSSDFGGSRTGVVFLRLDF
jgi:hypothetical protein